MAAEFVLQGTAASMSAFQWAIVIIYPAALTVLGLYLNFRGETNLHAQLTTRENEQRDAHERARRAIGQLQQVVERQDLLLMALWYQVYGANSPDEGGWEHPKERFRLAPDWKIHRSHLEMIRSEKYPWYQGIGEICWMPSIIENHD
jgi:hypothetical protein